MTKKTSGLILIALLMISLFNQCSKDDNTEEPANNNPTAAFSVNPSSGGLQTSFTFDASASHDPETADQELMVRWDFNGDGIWDTEYSDNKTATHQYASTGTFEAKLVVQDTDKNTDETSQSVTVSAGAPTASILVTPASGNTETLFEFDASGSSDEQTPTEDLLVRWDYDGNGSWDSDYSTSKISSHTYTTAGEFNATLEVKDGDNISSTASTLVNVVEAPAGCPETFVDPRDGQEYHAIEIGDQCWMAENLNIGSRIN
ncbi:MAG: PKD domain-containing protein, partial [Bacteroidales bacterium]|nr:PKD domain-containing protein [Bacteroidales bacterium]